MRIKTALATIALATAAITASLAAPAAANAAPAPTRAAAVNPQAVNGINYRISIYTSAVHSGSGTDDYVWVRINGSLGSSGWLGYLDTPFHDDFESGQTDQFFFTLPNLGVINSVDVYFRPYGTGPDWYPLEISVTPMSAGGGQGFHSYIDRWLTGEGWISVT
jgi:hypothetical protein